MRVSVMVLSFSLIILWFAQPVEGQALRNAPFGLSWGMSAEDVTKKGVKLSDKSTDKFGEQYSATNLPKMISDVETVTLYFGYNSKLWRIAAASELFQNDPYGSQVKARYDELNNVLSKKYGTGSRHHFRDDMWDEPDEFLMGLKTGRSWHYTNYDTETMFLQLRIGGYSSNAAVYAIIAKDKILEKTYKHGKKAKESEAL